MDSLTQVDKRTTRDSKSPVKKSVSTSSLKSPLKSPAKMSISKSSFKSPRKRVDRFNGIPEEEVARKFLPDHIDHNLDILIIGINPGLFAAYKGHHYAGPGNHFWKCLYLSGLTPELYTAYDDFRMLDYGIGFTNIVARTTRGSADLSRREIEEGGKILLTKLQFFKPKIAVFNGKGIYEIFSKKRKFCFGKQPDTLEGTNTHVWVMPSSSARCSQLPRAVDKAPFYVALKKFRDHLNGLLPDLKEQEIVFSDFKLKNYTKGKLRNDTFNGKNDTMTVEINSGNDDLSNVYNDTIGKPQNDTVDVKVNNVGVEVDTAYVNYGLSNMYNDTKGNPQNDRVDVKDATACVNYDTKNHINKAVPLFSDNGKLSDTDPLSPNLQSDKEFHKTEIDTEIPCSGNDFKPSDSQTLTHISNPNDICHTKEEIDSKELTKSTPVTVIKQEL